MMMMKIKYCILIMIASLAMHLEAQNQKSDVIFGGSFQGNFRSMQGTEVVSLELTPYAGYFVTKGLMVGMGVGIGGSFTTRTAFSPSVVYSSFNISLNPQLRYYFYFGKRVGLYPYAGFMYRYQWVKTQYNFAPATKDNYNLVGLNAGLGIPIYVSERLILEPSIGYRWEHLVSRNNPQDHNYIDFRIGLIYTIFRQ